MAISILLVSFPPSPWGSSNLLPRDYKPGYQRYGSSAHKGGWKLSVFIMQTVN